MMIKHLANDKRTRCPWCEKNPLDQHYHDTEWGVPMHDDRDLLELITLEGAQAGLSWSTILRKLDGYRRAYDVFDAEVIARYGDSDVARLLADADHLEFFLNHDGVKFDGLYISTV